MAAGIYNFVIEQGTTFIRNLFKYKDSNGDALSLSSHAVRMQLRTSINSTTTIISLTEVAGTNGSVITVGGTGNNEILITISAMTQLLCLLTQQYMILKLNHQV